MRRQLRITTCVALPVLVALVAARTADASTISTSTQTTTMTVRGLTTTDSALGVWLQNVTLSVVVPATSSSSFPFQIGTITRGTASVVSPVGLTLRVVTPWTVLAMGVSGSGLVLRIDSPAIDYIGSAVGTVHYTGGSVTGTIGASPASSFTVTNSAIESDIGTTLSYSRGAAFSLSPSLTYMVTP